MVAIVVANDCAGTVTSGGTTAPAGGTSETWTVNVTVAFPVANGSQQFYVADTAGSGAQLEKFLVTACPGGTGVQTWTVTRGGESTAPLAHRPGFAVQCVLTAGVANSYAQNPMTTLGDSIYGGASGLPTRLAGSTSSRKKVWSQTGTGTVSAAPAWAEPPRDSQNVVDYGADPTGVSSSSAAIQAAMNAGGPVYFPAGVYLLTAALNPTVTWVRLLGAGEGVTQLRYDGSVVTGGAIQMADTTTRRCDIFDMRISQTNATAAGTAINASYFIDSRIERVLIDGGGASGVPPIVGIDFNAAGTFYNSVTNCRVNSSGASNIGIRFSSGANSNMVTDCKITPDNTNTTGIGIEVNATAITLVKPDVENTKSTAINIDSSGHGCMVLAPYLEANNNGIVFASGVTSPVVTGGTVENSTVADFTDNGAIAPQVTGARSSAGGNHAYTKVLLDPTFYPDDQGLLAWSYDFVSASPTATAPGAGVVQMIKIAVRRPVTITNVLLDIVATGTLTAGQNFAGLYSASGTLLSATADQTTAWGTTGLKTMALSAAQAVLPGYYYVAFVMNGTPATVARASGVTGSGASLSAGLTASNGRWLTGPTVTALANVNMSTQTTLAGPAWWVAVS